MAEPLRVLLVAGATTGGIGRHVHVVARELTARGHSVSVCAPDRTGALFDWSAAGAAFTAAPVGATRPDRVIGAVRAIRALSDRADIVHVHGVRAAAVAAAARARPLIATWHNGPHDRWRRRFLHRAVERVAARGADLTLTVSSDLADRARRAGAGEVRTVAVVAPALPPPARSRADIRRELGAEGRHLVVAVGRLEPQKRLDVLVEAMIRWDRLPRPVAAIAGTGSLEPALRRQASAAGDSVRFLGRRADVADLLQAADVVALPSAWEGYPLLAQEALRVGAPLVATPVGGVPDLVGDAAVLVPPGDPDALRAALARLLADDSERADYAARGPAQAARWPTVGEMVDELVRCYRSATAGTAE